MIHGGENSGTETCDRHLESSGVKEGVAATLAAKMHDHH